MDIRNLISQWSYKVSVKQYMLKICHIVGTLSFSTFIHPTHTYSIIFHGTYCSVSLWIFIEFIIILLISKTLWSCINSSDIRNICYWITKLLCICMCYYNYYTICYILTNMKQISLDRESWNNYGLFLLHMPYLEIGTTWLSSCH